MLLAHKGEALFEAGTEEERRWAGTACTNDFLVDKGAGAGRRAGSKEAGSEGGAKDVTWYQHRLCCPCVVGEEGPRQPVKDLEDCGGKTTARGFVYFSP